MRLVERDRSGSSEVPHHRWRVLARDEHILRRLPILLWPVIEPYFIQSHRLRDLTLPPTILGSPSGCYELAAGWIFWSFANELGAPWSWGQSAAQNWIPEDPTEKIWPFYKDASSSCLDLSNPIDGNQNMPSFPSYANNVSNVDISKVHLKSSGVSSNAYSPITDRSESASATMSSVPGSSTSSTNVALAKSTSSVTGESAAHGRTIVPGAISIFILSGTILALIA